MRFALTEEQDELVRTVRSLLARHSDVRKACAQPRGYDEDLWRLMCDQVGVAALALPEEYGGVGATLFETALVLGELGADLTPSPLLASTLAAQALLMAGDHRHLESLAGGRTATVVWGDGPVLDGADADLLLAVRDGELYEVTGATRVRRTGMDLTLRYADVEVHETTPLGGLDAERLRDVATALVTALQVGGMQRCLEMTVSYTKERTQFGRQLGSFQALQHRMADLHVAVETSRSASWAACWSAARLDDALPRRAATAKAWCSDAFGQVAAETIQLHGGIAITWEHDAHLYFKRAHALGQLFGQPHEHRARVGQSLR